MPSHLPLLQRYCLDEQSPESGREHLSAYQARPRHPRYELFEPLESPLLQNEICLSPPQVIGVKRQSPPLGCCCLKQNLLKWQYNRWKISLSQKNQTRRRLCEPIGSHQLLLPNPCPGRFLTEAHSQVLSEWLTAARLHL